MENIVLFQKSSGEHVLLPLMSIQELHEIIYWRTSFTKTAPGATDEEIESQKAKNRLWVQAFLKKKFPELNEYDREAAFMAVYQASIAKSISKIPASCPRCQKTNTYIIDMSKSTDRELSTTIDAGGVEYRINYRLPTTVGGTDGGPESLQVLGFTEYTVDELEEYGITPDYGDEISRNSDPNTRHPWSPLEDFDILFHKDESKIPLGDLDPETKRQISVHIKNFGQHLLTEKAMSPISVITRYRCPCGFKSIRKLTNVHDFLMETTTDSIGESELVADYQMAVSLGELGVMSAAELKSLNRLEFGLIKGIMINRLKERKQQ